MIYRKSCSIFPWLMCLVLCVSAAPARADVLTVSVAGQFGPGVAADQLAAPDELWALSFEVDSSPAAANTDVFGFDAPFSDFSFMLNGSTIAVSPESIRFFTSSDGGLFTIFFGPETGFFDGMPIPEFSFSGDQVFSGPTTMPTIIPGSYPVGDVTYSDSLNFDDEGTSGRVTVAVSQSTVPEPSTLPLFLTVAVLMLFASLRRRLLARAAFRI